MVEFLLARDERPSAASARAGPPDLHLGGVQPQFHTFGPGVGEHILHSGQAHPWTVRGRASALGQQGAELADGTGDGGTIHIEQQSQDCVRQVMAQMDQGGRQTVDEDQLVPCARPSGPFPLPAPVPVVFDGRFPGVGQFLDEGGQVALGDAGGPGVGQDRTIDLDRRDQSMPQLSSETSPAITHQLVRGHLIWILCSLGPCR